MIPVIFLIFAMAVVTAPAQIPGIQSGQPQQDGSPDAIDAETVPAPQRQPGAAVNPLPGESKPPLQRIEVETAAEPQVQQSNPALPGPIDLDSGEAFQPPAALPNSRRRRPQLGAVAAGFSAAPTIIGDLFNSGTGSLNFGVRVRADAFFSSPVTYASTTELMNGFTAPIGGLTVTALDSIGGLVGANQSTFLSLSDITPINAVEIRATDDAVTVDNADLFGGILTAGRPLTDAAIFQAANNALERELSSSLSQEVSVEELATLEYLENQSTLEIDDSNEVTSASFVYRIGVRIPVPAPGEVIGRYSIADNNSPFPRDRLFLDYNFFHNARVTAVGIPINRWAPGFEKTFHGGTASIEVRAPMAITLNSRVSTSGEDLANYEFGDIAMSLKTLVLSTNQFAFTLGMGITLPTADDFELVMENDGTAVRIKNESVHLLPFTAFIVRPTARTFLQSFAQLDIDVNGNPVELDEDAFLQFGGSGLSPVGRLRGQTVMRWNSSLGAFLVQRPGRRLSRVAAVLESHYTATLNRSNSVGSENLSVGDPTQSLNVLNLTSGLHFYMGQSVATLGYGVPVTSDRVFDGELRAYLNRYF